MCYDVLYGESKGFGVPQFWEIPVSALSGAKNSRDASMRNLNPWQLASGLSIQMRVETLKRQLCQIEATYSNVVQLILTYIRLISDHFWGIRLLFGPTHSLQKTPISAWTPSPYCRPVSDERLTSTVHINWLPFDHNTYVFEPHGSDNEGVCGQGAESGEF